jgi:hypothetical protein
MRGRRLSPQKRERPLSAAELDRSGGGRPGSPRNGGEGIPSSNRTGGGGGDGAGDVWTGPPDLDAEAAEEQLQALEHELLGSRTLAFGPAIGHVGDHHRPESPQFLQQMVEVQEKEIAFLNRSIMNQVKLATELRKQQTELELTLASASEENAVFKSLLQGDPAAAEVLNRTGYTTDGEEGEVDADTRHKFEREISDGRDEIARLKEMIELTSQRKRRSQTFHTSLQFKPKPSAHAAPAPPAKARLDWN